MGRQLQKFKCEAKDFVDGPFTPDSSQQWEVVDSLGLLLETRIAQMAKSSADYFRAMARPVEIGPVLVRADGQAMIWGGRSEYNSHILGRRNGLSRFGYLSENLLLFFDVSAAGMQCTVGFGGCYGATLWKVDDGDRREGVRLFDGSREGERVKIMPPEFSAYVSHELADAFSQTGPDWLHKRVASLKKEELTCLPFFWNLDHGDRFNSINVEDMCWIGNWWPVTQQANAAASTILMEGFA